MKKTLLTGLLMIGAASVFGQASLGFITWGNAPTGFRAPIYNVDPGSPSVSTVGQSSLGTPTGSTVFAGPLLGASGNGATYTMAFFAGNGNAPSNALVLVASTTFRTATGNALPAGLVTGSTVSVPGTAAGNSGEFQIRVWNNQGGTITTWAAAEAAWLSGLTAAGVSPLVQVTAYGGTDSNANSVSTPIDSGWSSFSLTSTTVPEPTTLTLAGLGAAALLIFRRRK